MVYKHKFLAVVILMCVPGARSMRVTMDKNLADQGLGTDDTVGTELTGWPFDGKGFGIHIELDTGGGGLFNPDQPALPKTVRVGITAQDVVKHTVKFLDQQVKGCGVAIGRMIADKAGQFAEEIIEKLSEHVEPLTPPQMKAIWDELKEVGEPAPDIPVLRDAQSTCSVGQEFVTSLSKCKELGKKFGLKDCRMTQEGPHGERCTCEANTGEQNPSEGYVLLPGTASACPAGFAITSKAECEGAYDSVAIAESLENTRGMQSGAWDGVPVGCSVQYQNAHWDQAPHWSTASSSSNSRIGEFRVLCKQAPFVFNGVGVAGPEVWLNQYSLGEQACYEAVMSDGRCQKRYFTYVARGDKNCGCTGHAGGFSVRATSSSDYYSIPTDDHTDDQVQVYLCQDGAALARKRTAAFQAIQAVTNGIHPQIEMFTSTIKALREINRKALEEAKKDCVIPFDKAYKWMLDNRCTLMGIALSTFAWAADKALLSAATAASGGTFMAAYGAFAASLGAGVCTRSSGFEGVLAKLGKWGPFLVKKLAKVLGKLMCFAAQQGFFLDVLKNSPDIKDRMAWESCTFLSIQTKWFGAGISLLCGKIVSAVTAFFEPLLLRAIDPSCAPTADVSLVTEQQYNALLERPPVLSIEH